MPNPENVIGKGNRFSSTNQPANRGRKPRLYTIAKKTYNISHDDFIEVVKYLMQLSKKGLEKIAAAEDTPIWVINIARALHKDTGKGVTYTLRELLDRLWGKATQPIAGKNEGPIELKGSIDIREWVKDRLQQND